MADPRPDLRKVKTKAGGDLYVDFNLLNPDQQKKAMQYTPEVMSSAPVVAQPEPEKLYETPQDAPGLMSAPVRPEELQSTVPAPTPSPDVVSATPYTADLGEPMWRGAPEPAAMVAPTATEDTQQQIQPQIPRQEVSVVEDQPITGGVDYVRTGGGGISKRTKIFQENLLQKQEEEKQAAILDKQTQAAGAADLANVYGWAQQDVSAKQAQFAKQKEVAQKAYADTVARHDAAIEEVRNAIVNPNNWFASKTTGQQILAGIVMALSGKGTDIFNNAIDRDIKSQVYTLEQKKEYVNGLKISADMKKDMIADIDQQGSLAASRSIEAAKLKLQEISSRTNSEQLKAQASQLDAQLTQKQIILQEEFAQKAARAAAQGVKEMPWIATPFGKMHVTPAQYLQYQKDQATGGLTAGEQLQREKFEYEKGKDAKAMSVTGYEGQAPSEPDARRFREALPTYQATIKAIEDMEKLAEGTNFLERGAAKVPGLYSNLKTKSTQIRSFAGALYKGLPQIAFGALSEGDRGMVDDFLTDPMAFVQKGGNIKRAKEIVQNMVKEHATSINLRSKTAPSSGVKVGL